MFGQFFITIIFKITVSLLNPYFAASPFDIAASVRLVCFVSSILYFFDITI